MANVISTAGLTVELSAQEVTLIREALSFSLRENGHWERDQDAAAGQLMRDLDPTGPR